MKSKAFAYLCWHFHHEAGFYYTYWCVCIGWCDLHSLYFKYVHRIIRCTRFAIHYCASCLLLGISSTQSILIIENNYTKCDFEGFQHMNVSDRTDTDFHCDWPSIECSVGASFTIHIENIPFRVKYVIQTDSPIYYCENGIFFSCYASQCALIRLASNVQNDKNPMILFSEFSVWWRELEQYVSLTAIDVLCYQNSDGNVVSCCFLSTEKIHWFTLTQSS